jgi:glycosyltransferase involved in cell wall biosynthesis
MDASARRSHESGEAAAGPDRKLLIAIPALNEEESIEGIIERALAARDDIVANSPVTEVEITVVSDGSTDRTVELASRYTESINLIVFERNHGYGASIMEAWRRSDAEYLAFIDADGTCDPALFSKLCTALELENADVVLGCRLNRDSRMPALRWLGNIAFALLLSAFSSARVRDAASGMRVVRRASLPKLLPLPDGLHFTPAMSARAVLSDDLRIVEIDMPYHERAGESKLRVARDGVRFLKVILEAAWLYRPSRPLGLLGVLCLAIAGGLMAGPTKYYVEHRSVLEWMIYRFVVSELLGTSGCLLLSASYLTMKTVRLTLSQGRDATTAAKTAAERFIASRLFWVVPIALSAAGGALVLPSAAQLVTTGATYEHWSRFVVMSFLVSVSVMLVVTRLIDYTLELIAARLAYLKRQAGE